MKVEVLRCMSAVWLKAGRVLGLLAGLCLLAGTAWGQAEPVRVSGSVAEARTRLPVPGATVQVQRTRRGVVTSTIGEFSIDISRPRDVAEIKTTPRFIELHAAIWAVLRDEVLKGYAQQLQVNVKVSVKVNGKVKAA